MRPRWQACVFAAIGLAALLGCGGGGGGSTPPPLQPPASLTYGTNPATYTVGTAITANTPTSSGGAVASYTVSPALPSGLALSASSGVITGTPTAMTPRATYTVTASNTAGSTTAPLVGGGYTRALGSHFFWNAGIFLGPGKTLKTQTSTGSEEDSGVFDIQVQAGLRF